MTDLGRASLTSFTGLDSLARLLGLVARPDTLSPCIDSSKLSDLDLLTMPAPASVPTTLWLLSSPAERRALLTADGLRQDQPPAQPSVDGVGTLSTTYETGGRGPGTVSSGKGDLGGVSYGSYQLATNMGKPQDFLLHEGKPWAKEFGALKPGTPEFTKVWKAIAAREPEAFQKAQHAYIGRSHYAVTAEGVAARTGYDVTNKSATLRDVIWSTSVHLGKDTRAIDKAIAKVDKTMKRDDPRYERALIEAVYAERFKQDAGGAFVYFRSSPGSWKGLANRYKSEAPEALSRYDSEIKAK